MKVRDIKVLNVKCANKVLSVTLSLPRCHDAYVPSPCTDHRPSLSRLPKHYRYSYSCRVVDQLTDVMAADRTAGPKHDVAMISTTTHDPQRHDTPISDVYIRIQEQSRSHRSIIMTQLYSPFSAFFVSCTINASHAHMYRTNTAMEVR